MRLQLVPICEAQDSGQGQKLSRGATYNAEGSIQQRAVPLLSANSLHVDLCLDTCNLYNSYQITWRVSQLF